MRGHPNLQLVAVERLIRGLPLNRSVQQAKIVAVSGARLLAYRGE